MTILNDISREPVSIEEAKRHLKIDYTTDDGLISIFITSARKKIEAFTGVSLGVKKIEHVVTVTNANNPVDIPYGPFVEMVDIEYRDYRLNPYESILDQEDDNWELEGGDFKKIVADRGSYKLTYRTGFEEVPEDLKLAVLAEVASLYQHRGDTPERMSPLAKELATPYKRQLWLV